MFLGSWMFGLHCYLLQNVDGQILYVQKSSDFSLVMFLYVLNCDGPASSVAAGNDSFSMPE